MTTRPWHTPAATAAPPTPLGDLFLAHADALAAEEQVKADYREGRKGQDDLIKASAVTLQAQDAFFRRLRELHPEEIGGGS